MFSNLTTANRRNPAPQGVEPTTFSDTPHAAPEVFTALSLRAVNTAALNWGMRRLMARRALDLRAVAKRSWEIHTAEITFVPPAIHLPETLDRVSALSPWRDWENEKQIINGGPLEHAATEAHLIEGANISGAFIYCGAAKMQSGYGTQKLIRPNKRPVEHIKEAHLLSNWAGSYYFGMFMRGVLPMELLTETGAPTISMPTKHYMHVAGYRELLSMPRPPMVTDARIEQLTLYTDFGQNQSKAERYGEMRRRLRKAIGGNRIAPQGIYLKRGATGEQRIVANEAEVEATLTAMGFEVVEPAKLTSHEIAQRMIGAPVVVSVEGSHMAHAIYTLAEGGTLLALQPPDRLALAFKEFTDRAGLRFGFTVGKAAEGGFHVDIDDLKRTLDLVDQQRRPDLVS